mgnify:CR=1 FL=1
MAESARTNQPPCCTPHRQTYTYACMRKPPSRFPSPATSPSFFLSSLSLSHFFPTASLRVLFALAFSFSLFTERPCASFHRFMVLLRFHLLPHTLCCFRFSLFSFSLPFLFPLITIAEFRVLLYHHLSFPFVSGFLFFLPFPCHFTSLSNMSHSSSLFFFCLPFHNLPLAAR